MNNIAAIVLAGGKGTRIGQSLPKVLCPIVGKPMIYYTLETIHKVPIQNIFVVVGFRSFDVQGSIRDEKINYIYQQEQLGTAHALKLSVSELPPECKEIIVFNGDDSAFYDVFTIREFLKSYRDYGAKLSFMTAKVKKPTGFGRVLRGINNGVLRIVEEKEATVVEKKITEVNVGCYIFDVDWVSKSIDKVKKSRNGEYYITDLVSIALKERVKVNTFLLKDNKEWVGINTQEELQEADKRMLARLKREKKPTVFIFDLDNTLINTDAVKEFVSKKLVPKILSRKVKDFNKDELLKLFWKEYEQTRKRLGFVSIPDFSDSFAKRIQVVEYANEVRRMFYTIPFDRFVYDGVYELMEYIKEKGEIVIVSEGDLVYQPMKIKNLNFSKDVNEIFVFENKNKNIKKIVKIYEGRRKIVIDDKMTDLEAFAKVSTEILTIHIKQGIYGNLSPLVPTFSPDFEAKNIHQVRKYIQEIY